MDALANLPGDVLVAILVRLPALSIARCRQVCRAWRSAISHPSFDVAHTERPATVAKLTAGEVPFDFNVKYGTSGVLKVLTMTSVVFDLFRGRWHRDNVHTNPRLTRALILQSASWVHGSWDGVVCIKLCFRPAEWSPFPLPHPAHVDQYVLWNPLTTACATVSPPGDGAGEIIGAYSHPSTRRFHLVHASGEAVGDHLMAPTTFRILRVGDAVWREIPLMELDNSTSESKISMARRHARCVRLHGNLHWLVLWGSSESMAPRLLTFDTAREKFRFMEAPPTRHQGPPDGLTNTRLSVLSGGKLCTFVVEPSASSMAVWVLDDYEAVPPLSSWRLKERISLVSWDRSDLARKFCMDTDVEVVKGAREGEEIFVRIVGSSRIDAYNLRCKEWHRVNVSQSVRTVMHRESILQHEVSFGGASRALSRKDKNGHICYYL